MPRLISDRDRDLFDKSTMSFGAHLDELRQTLIKASLWLALGTAIGVYFAADVVKFVSKPFQDELKQLQVSKFSDAFREVNHREPSSFLLDWMLEYGMLPENILVLDVGENGLVDVEVGADEVVLRRQMMLSLANQTQVRLKSQIQMRSVNFKLKSFELVEGFMIYFKASLLVGALISSPAVFWHLWSYLAAGLYANERRNVYMFLPISLSLFIAGVVLAFFVILRLLVSVLMATSDSLGVEFEPRLHDCLSYVLLLPLGFGIAFQLPIAMLALNRFGIIPIEIFVQHWRVAVLAIAFVSMLLTPPDATTMIAMFVPLTLLYFLGVLLCKVMPIGVVGRNGNGPV